jgi:mRNA deadenylase 3'-5' endonuclease subunit Ccr4
VRTLQEEALRAEEGPEGWVERENEHRLSEARKKGKNEADVELLRTTNNYNGLPNSVFGSDHLPLMAVFECVTAADPTSQGH